ncbi:outer membrane lipoprotein carrier protein LolA [Candidatus Williamhamiltonella defendens]|uniref:Outer-membrane lipoprotein carrier protein n=2 Tax=Candidatus Williamhamiltonella defendens TaxID=138072 RepID=A0A2D3T0J6_9ENTR|nr:outer membrane lipoprotein chaperone LolA [Candidatus Hamiltonella defensa]ACQ67524.1 periplasmic chaperone effects translocation of lipoproteins from inner membrane to outer membrane [Candidatus Hamiltonella defensa 5AT (Acyrthosiphon pisum)]ATW22233.1 outer membrane lipoprotein carrier protein LolA [Candidatus Hamiltonella defensa]ATW29310.1 outer membrane lipoprotein carrier protein LolA [Candidatus Hamiltonella defensa]ATW31288.1 outer membrane lipoprotein carrier protein LolA [Candidatu
MIKKKWLFVLSLFITITAPFLLADPQKDLQQRLNESKNFYAHFLQKVSRLDGTVIQEARGELWLKHPNLFDLHMMPDESRLISDGETLWFYNPMLEQVTANWLKNAVGNTPFMLIAYHDPKNWEKYQVEQKGDTFQLIPKIQTGDFKQFSINITPEGIINSFRVLEENQISEYVFQNQSKKPIASSKFTFTVPLKVTLDDQRQ